jgi:disulfide oxidoreductase YuzD
MSEQDDDKPEIKWLDAPEDHDYPAAESYLSLVYEDVQDIVSRLRSSDLFEFKAKDVFRASRLSLLGISNKHVLKDRDKIAKGKALSPLLLVRDNGSLVIADGYHRLCAVYSVDEDALIPCKIVTRA